MCSSDLLNDLFDVREFIKDIDYNIFIQENIEELDIPKSDLVVSSSVFQWIKDIESLIRNIAEHTDNLCFSSYIFGNLLEIKNHFGVSLDYLNIEEFEEILKKYFSSVKSYSETIKVNIVYCQIITTVYIAKRTHYCIKSSIITWI